MIQKSTVLILGAGASYPYGYPLGGQLVDVIVSMTSPETGALRKILPREHRMQQLHDRLQHSEVSSIDAFLESNPALADLGKICIAAALTLNGPPISHKVNSAADWYKYLWGRLYEGAGTVKEFRKNQLRIITYNYDRSLERYLYKVVKNTYHELWESEPERTVALIDEVIPMVHLHGSLGGTDDTAQKPSQDRALLYDAAFVQHAAKNIRIVHEDQLSDEYALAHEWLTSSDVVHFLGFGYHATNVRRLNLPASLTRRACWDSFGGTAFRMENAERTRAQATLGIGAVTLQPVDSLEYLRKYASLE